MTKFAFLMTFVSLLVAIGLSDLLMSLHKLLRLRKEINWSWILITWSVIIFILIINLWFGIYLFLDLSLNNTSAGFVIYILPLIFLLLSCFAVLPDKPRAGLDLSKWYIEQKKYIFSLLLLNFLTLGFIRIVQLGFNDLIVLFTTLIIPLIITLSLLIVLIVTNKRRVHAVITIIFLVLFIFVMINQRLYIE